MHIPESHYITQLDIYMWYMLICAGILFFISGIDELIFDIIYWVNYIYRRLTHKKQRMEDIPVLPEKRIAIMVPCWHESLVIQPMLQHNTQNLAYHHYDFFIGVYPNDTQTIDAVKMVAEQYSHIHIVIGNHPGPTRKADNLNQVFQYILQYEKESGKTYDIFLMHDAEDRIHPQALTLCNYGITSGKDMVQIPIFPMPVKLYDFTHWIYNDEFAELHTKNIVVRNLLQTFVPSAGVGTAFSRKSMMLLSHNYSQQPFNNSSLTEDYNVALRLHNLGLQGHILLYQTRNKHHKWEYVATRSLFPTRYKSAVRQRTRWTLGITLQEWATTGWPGNIKTKYSLLQDRKALIGNFINGFAYLVGIYWLAVFFIALVNHHPAPLTLLLDANPPIEFLIILVTLMMGERLLQRCIATTRIYGPLSGVLSLLRAPYGNIMNLHIAIRAIGNFLQEKIYKKPVKWAKTTNLFQKD